MPGLLILSCKRGKKINNKGWGEGWESENRFEHGSTDTKVICLE